MRIPPKRVRLIGIFSGSVLYLLLVYPMLRIMLDAIGGSQYAILAIVPIIGMFGIIVAIPYFILVAVWAFARLALNLPALILTPAGIVNHNIVYNVVVPWDEIERFTCVVPEPSRYRRGMTGNYITVHEKDERRLYAMQQPLTRALLRLFSRACPGKYQHGDDGWDAGGGVGAAPALRPQDRATRAGRIQYPLITR